MMIHRCPLLFRLLWFPRTLYRHYWVATRYTDTRWRALTLAARMTWISIRPLKGSSGC